jgi:DNA-binding protein HU-beta
MNKNDLIEAVAKNAGLSKAASGKALNAALDSIKKGLKKEGDRVTLVGFGTFSVVKRKARKGINPQTKEKIKIKAKKVVKFKPGKGLLGK